MKNFNFLNQIKIIFITVVIVFINLACSGDNGNMDPTGGPPDPKLTLVQTFQINLSAQYSIPANSDRNETGTATLELFSDNSLKYSISVANLASSDFLITSHIHLGDLVSTGNILITLVDGTDRTFNGNSATGTVILSSLEKTSLQGDNVYLNVHSDEIKTGLIRGPVDTEIDFAMDIMLSPDNNVPPLMGRNETGVTYLRLSSESILYYKITINDLDMSDIMRASHLHIAMSDANGSVFKTLVTEMGEYGISKSLSLDENERSTFLNEYIYVNAHSVQEPDGLIRGQIR
jgi:hypothetical protein